MYYKPSLKRSVYAAKTQDGDLMLGINPITNTQYISNISELHKRLFELLDGGLTINELCNLLKQEKFDLNEQDLIEVLEQLDELGLIEDVCEERKLLSEESLIRYDRQLLLFSSVLNANYKSCYEYQKKLENTHVCILGIGGTGSYVFYGLAAMGVGKITVVDFDKVEKSNLSRQILYGENDLGKYKIDVLKEKCSNINKNIEYIFHNMKISTTEDIEKVIKDSNFVVLSADTPRGKIKYMLNEVCCKLNIPFLCSAGTATDLAICGPIVVPGKTACYQCSIKDEDRCYIDETYLESINKRYTTTVIDPYNAVSASIGVLETIKHITGFSPCRLYNHIYEFDFNTLESRFREIEKNSDCKICGNK